ncbi:hypothetical protein [Limnospira platensis]|nr:hypothetical protein [Limnospira sp. PMC 289.06]MDT9296026.1 hypothetical protein [Arthrospira platensis PCC 7345]
MGRKPDHLLIVRSSQGVDKKLPPLLPQVGEASWRGIIAESV